jgi:ceramide glucosyltransferase
VVLNTILGFLALLSLVLLLWQWMAARRFPLHQRISDGRFAPGVTLLKPLKGYDEETEACLRSWFKQEYTGEVQLLLGVASETDPVCEVVRKLQREFPRADTDLIVCGPLSGTNLKVSKLVQLERLAKHEVLVISDADVLVGNDFLANGVAPLKDARTGLVNCFYQLGSVTTMAMRWEAVAINADFWSQVLQAQSLKPLDFALGAVMLTRSAHLSEIGGFEGLKDCLADDYQLGNRIVRRGHRITLCPVVVECRSAPMGWGEVWRHQLRWARTIRVCQPLPYFFSILSNPTLWPLVWLTAVPTKLSLGFAAVCWAVRCLTSLDLQKRLTRQQAHPGLAWLALVKDLLQAGIWLLAFCGNRVEWRGERMKLRRDGTLVRREISLKR